MHRRCVCLICGDGEKYFSHLGLEKAGKIYVYLLPAGTNSREAHACECGVVMARGAHDDSDSRASCEQ